MGKRIFMDVPHVFSVADNLGNYSETQTQMIERYSLSVKKMVTGMEGNSKESLEKAAIDIQKESLDAIGRMKGFSFIYKTTGNNRLSLDKEGAESAKIDNPGLKIGTGSPGTVYTTPVTQLTPNEIEQYSEWLDILIKGYIPWYVSNDTVVEFIDHYAELSWIRKRVIEKHRSENVEKIDEVYNRGQYIENQGEWKEVQYGDYDMSYDGCGIIAIVNAYHSLGVDLTSDQVAELISEFEKNGIVSNGKWGTSPLAIIEYFENNTYYTVDYTTSTEIDKIEEIANNSDTIIVEVYNNGMDISEGMHFVNIEKRIDENGEVTYIVHNSDCYKDDNENNYKDEGEDYIEYSSIEKALDAIGKKDASKPIIVIGLSKPKIDDDTNKED